MEDAWLGYATERIFLPLAKLTMPEIVNYHLPPEGIFHNLVFVSIDKQYPDTPGRSAPGCSGWAS
jgi:4-hydroxy-3-polyprenylbenzoate decarboxylase